jgi:hypothetical protein
VAFLRYANARTVRPFTTGQGWDNVRVAAAQARMDRNLVGQASKILNEQFDPSKYLLSHATIVASVDCLDVPNVKLGAGTADGKPVIRKTTAYRIKPECEQFINNNFDSWARPVLLKSYKTFIGAHNFLEHVQIENLSKGRILDAVARDIGDSIYIDILIATDRKHRELIKDIESGELSTLSMGCSIDGSTCTKCGHWAADETEFCDHVKYAKGNTFFDEKGQKHRIAELCGDVTLDPTGGVQFIEASWVKVPAFKGAVARNLITLSSDDKGKTAKRIQNVMDTPAPKVPTDGYLKAARKVMADEFGLDEEGGDAAPADKPEAPAEPADPLKGITDELKQYVLDNLKKSLKEDLSKSDLAKDILPPDASIKPNDTVVKQARAKRAAYLSRVRSIIRTAGTDREVLQKIALLNREFAIFVPENLYRTALKVGGSHHYASLPSFIDGCRGSLGRDPTVREARALIRLAKLLSTRTVGVKPKKP